MKKNITRNPMIRSKALHLGAFVLATGIGLSAVGCNQDITKLFFTVTGKDLEVVFCDRGASIYSIKYKDKYVTYHPKDMNVFLKDDNYYGKALGRVAGRIKDGDITIDGKQYKLEVNETSGKKNNSLHGGTHGINTKDFSRLVKEDEKYTTVTFNYISPALEAGYPETLNSTFTYRVGKVNSVIDLQITATTSGKTLVNLSTHPYFRLDDTGDVLSHRLTIPTKTMAKFSDNDDQVVVDTQDVGTIYDFSEGKLIGEDIEKVKKKDPVSGGYDHIWKFDDVTKQYVNLYNPDNGYNLRVDTDADGVILYANCYPHDGMEMNPSGNDALYSGITIEPIKFFTKDSVNDLIIDSNQTFTRRITYTFSVEK